MLYEDDGLAEEFHVGTNNLGSLRFQRSAHLIHYDARIQKLVKDAPLRLEGKERVKLAPPAAIEDCSLGAAIRRRVSSREYSKESIELEQLSTLLHYSNGFRNSGHRNAPSSGNLGSVEIFPIVLRVLGVQPGIYHYDTSGHFLSLVQRGEFATWLREYAVYQREFSDAALALVLVGSIGRVTSKYGARGYRLVLLDVGHVSENAQLVATAAGLRVCATAGFIDGELNRALGIDGLTTASFIVLLVGA
ncbi:SagB/ThcOx family dehydrogenase [Streptomyces sp. NPDC057193]|uniref:SagB/ThcOx family dehydrogenase n=1 Tax=unclassified Streptomyces TaxID=2593676 RepID=UPI00363C5A7D